MRNLLIAILILTIFSAVFSTAEAKVVTEKVEYRHGNTILEGYLAYDDSIKGKRPGVLVVHEWWGLNDYAKARTRELAKMGYNAFALDMYGKGKVTKDYKQAGKWSGMFKGKPIMRERAKAGLKILANHPLTDKNRIAAMGYCFGGTTVLELAYSGADINGVLSFHGSLTSPKPEDLKNIKAKIMVLHGAIDPHVSGKSIDEFQEMMEKAKADWQMVYFGGAVHSFTNPASGNDVSKGVAYNEKAAKRSWKYMKMFFEEIFK